MTVFSAPAVVLPSILLPGEEIGYDQITANVPLTGTTEGAPTTVITCNAHDFDGSPVMANFWTSALRVDTGGVGDNAVVGLFEGGTLINRLGFAQTPTTGGFVSVTINGLLRFTPSAGSHSYVVAAWVTSSTGTPLVVAGVGGPGNNPPAFMRFTKV